jgi:hypothetical protein
MSPRMFGLPQSAAKLDEDMTQVTAHAKKLEDGRLAFNQVVAHRRTYESSLRTHRQALDIILDRISREKETATMRSDKNFEESQAKAKKDHAAHKAVLAYEIRNLYSREKTELEDKISKLGFDNCDESEKEEVARDAYHQADIEFMEATAKRKTELEAKGELKRKREVSPVISAPYLAR